MLHVSLPLLHQVLRFIEPQGVLQAVSQVCRAACRYSDFGYSNARPLQQLVHPRHFLTLYAFLHWSAHTNGESKIVEQ